MKVSWHELYHYLLICHVLNVFKQEFKIHLVLRHGVKASWHEPYHHLFMCHILNVLMQEFNIHLVLRHEVKASTPYRQEMDMLRNKISPKPHANRISKFLARPSSLWGPTQCPYPDWGPKYCPQASCKGYFKFAFLVLLTTNLDQPVSLHAPCSTLYGIAVQWKFSW